MISKHSYHKMDPFVVLLLVVFIGLTATIAYQLRWYSVDGMLMAKNSHAIGVPPWEPGSAPKNLVAQFKGQH
ncbi:hypothetical protein TI04_12185 [Achromatium sp. WMS2]|nr:hypothetical protein TI04_12185 [Achromatium sp. WMS2]